MPRFAKFALANALSARLVWLGLVCPTDTNRWIIYCVACLYTNCVYTESISLRGWRRLALSLCWCKLRDRGCSTSSLLGVREYIAKHQEMFLYGLSGRFKGQRKAQIDCGSRLTQSQTTLIYTATAVRNEYLDVFAMNEIRCTESWAGMSWERRSGSCGWLVVKRFSVRRWLFIFLLQDMIIRKLFLKPATTWNRVGFCVEQCRLLWDIGGQCFWMAPNKSFSHLLCLHSYK